MHAGYMSHDRKGDNFFGYSFLQNDAAAYRQSAVRADRNFRCLSCVSFLLVSPWTSKRAQNDSPIPSNREYR